MSIRQPIAREVNPPGIIIQYSRPTNRDILMRRIVKRVVIAVAAAITCFVMALGGIPPGPAFADPNPQESRSEGSGFRGGSRLDEVRRTLDTLYRQADAATDAYNLAETRAEKQALQIKELSKRMGETRRRLARIKTLAGLHARAQYRTGGLPFQVQLFLEDQPSSFLESLGRGYEAAQTISKLLDEMSRAQTDLGSQAQEANVRYETLDRIRRKRAAARSEVQKRIVDAEALEASLKQQEKVQLQKLQQTALDRAQAAWLSSGITDGANNLVSEKAKQALTYATAQIGKPYEWGAEGPNSYDCSGLTSEAWKSAGVPMPRTSQEQWAQLAHVKISDMRPGDLIIYNQDASHVAIYIGDGSIVHAPRPGRNITIAGAGSMEILGVVRPAL
ncbi:NlpC/P60 family protein [Streptomyces roseus]|uniref:C40 family peptidase n=1 Tax=Streptomyces roseus TaxID=66430 RepID=UPI00381DEFBD